MGATPPPPLHGHVGVANCWVGWSPNTLGAVGGLPTRPPPPPLRGTHIREPAFASTFPKIEPFSLSSCSSPSAIHSLEPAVIGLLLHLLLVLLGDLQCALPGGKGGGIGEMGFRALPLVLWMLAPTAPEEKILRHNVFASIKSPPPPPHTKHVK